ncbi:MAG: peptidase M28, partial [Bacteroidetes bacterium]|nr:peptidase M28 [Bacteroidota bacterium]
MNSRTASLLLAGIIWLSQPPKVGAQTFPVDDPIVKAMWEEGIENSQTKELAHQLVDVIGPRLTGTAGLEQAQDWL